MHTGNRLLMLNLIMKTVNPADDDEEDSDVLDPAQLAVAYADQQMAPSIQHQHQQPQNQHLHLQLQPLRPPQQQQQQVDHQAPAMLQPPTAEPASWSLQPEQPIQHAAVWSGQDHESDGNMQGWPQVDLQGQEEDDDEEEEEELICMDDPRFVMLSERKQKLMALEEILLNTGIEG